MHSSSLSSFNPMAGAIRKIARTPQRKPGQQIQRSKNAPHIRFSVAATTALAVTIYLLSPVLNSGLDARSTKVFEAPGVSEQDLNRQLLQVLDKVDPVEPNKPDETAGFRSRLSSSWLSPFSYDIYTGPISARIPTTILRIEASDGDARILSQVFLQEKLIPRDALDLPDGPGRSPGYKSHLVSQGLNWIAPWVGIWYNEWNSPRLTSGQRWFRFLAYFLADAVLVGAAGTNWFQESFDASEYGSRIGVALALPRLVGAWQSYHTISGHNQLVELKYTFHFE